MKLYTFLSSLLLVATLAPLNSKAQCSCPMGDQPDSTVHTQVFDSITPINTTVTFPGFDPTVGTLSCLRLASTVTTVINLDLYNKEAFDVTYMLESFRRSIFSGPGGFFSSITSTPKTYGPYNLKAIDPVGTDDETHIGPDTVFNNRYTNDYHYNVASFLGPGSVNFDYLNTSTTTLLQGSSNYDLFVRAYTRMNVRLVYFWCPNELLATNIKDFSALLKDKNIFLKWVTENNVEGSTYHVQYSEDGKRFTNLNQGTINAAGSMKHEFQYAPARNVNQTMYFRIRYKDAGGKVSYSTVRSVNLNEAGKASFVVFPNPIVRKVSMQFDKNMSGEYAVQMTNLAGQVLYQKNIRLSNSNLLQFELAQQPPVGIYYIRATDITNNKTYSEKIAIHR